MYDSESDSGSNSSTDSEDDPVVAELDVYLTDATDKSLYLLQYPTIPTYHPTLSPTYRLVQPIAATTNNSSTVSNINSNVTSAVFRPNNNSLKLSVDTKPSYKPNSHTNSNIQNHYEVDEETQENNTEDYLRYLTFNSRQIPTLRNFNAHCVGVVHKNTFTNKNELHLTPLNNVFSMTPDLSHLDQEIGKPVKGMGKGGDVDEEVSNREVEVVNVEDTTEVMDAIEQEEYDQERENAPVSVNVYQFKRETERTAAYRKKSFKHLNKQIESEPWVRLDVNKDAGSSLDNLIEKSLVYKHKLDSEFDIDFEDKKETTENDATGVGGKANAADYLNSLVPV